MKLTKLTRKLAVVLTIVFTLTLMAPYSLASDASLNSAYLDDVAAGVEQSLPLIEAQKKEFRMDGIDFSTLMLGREIPAYVVSSNGTLIPSDIRYFPILSGGVWVATAAAYNDAAGNVQVQISTDYVEEYHRSKRLGTAGIALVFDDTQAYIYSNGNFVSASRAFAEVEGRGDITLISNNTVISSVRIASLRLLASNARGITDVRTLSIPAVTQGYPYSCLLACLTSVINYFYGSNTTSEAELIAAYAEFSEWPYNPNTTGASEGFIAPCLADFALLCKDTVASNYSWNEYKKTIKDEYNPIIAACNVRDPNSSSNSAIGHTVVIRGYVENIDTERYGSLSYLDPESGTFKAANVPLTGAVTGTTVNNKILTIATLYEAANLYEEIR